MRSKAKKILEAGIISVCLIFLSSCVPPEKIFIKKTAEGGYLLFVKDKPFIVKGVIYNPTPPCEGYDYELFSDPNKPWLVDGKLMKEMGVNTVRIYSVGADLEKAKEFIKDMYEKFGIYTIVGDWLGLWDIPGPNYADENFRQRTKERVMKIVKALKDEKGVLMWILGNENNYTFSGKIAFWTSEEIEALGDAYKKTLKRAEIYYSFVDELAKQIKKIDPNHPVVMSNGEVSMLEVAAKVCPDIDALGIISYRGKRFANLFENIRYVFDKPVLVSEFGADSYDAYKEVEAGDIQAEYLGEQWKDIFKNSVLSGKPDGNVLGGTIFEWADEWWKHNEGYTPGWCQQDTEGGWSNGSYWFDIKAKNNLNMNEEWFGLLKISPDKENGLNKRIPKKAFHVLKELWKEK